MPDPLDSLGAFPDYPHGATLARDLSGKGTEAGVTRVEQWLPADPSHPAELAALRTAWNPSVARDPGRADRMWTQLAARLEQTTGTPALVTEPLPEAPRRVRRGFGSHRQPWGGVAAAVGLP